VTTPEVLRAGSAPYSESSRSADVVDERGAEGSLVVPTLSGFAAVVVLSIGATLAGSPYVLHLPGAWLFGTGKHTVEARTVGIIGVFAGMAVLIVAWCQLVGYLRRHPVTPVRTVAVIFALWALPAIIAPPMFSRDVYSYAADGQMVTSGINPYVNGPDSLAFVAPQYASLVDPIWRQTPTPYGPLSLGLDAGIVDVTGHHEVAAIEGLRLLALAGVILAAALLPGLARQWGTAPSLVVALAVLNPLTLLGLISPGHNDALMIGLMIAALALSRRGRPFLAVAVCALAASVKSPALLATAFIAWEWASRELTWRGRGRMLTAMAVVTFGVLEAVTLLTGLGWGWVHTAGIAGMVQSVTTPTTDLALLAEKVVHVVRFGPSVATLIKLTRGLGYMVIAATCGWLLWRRERVGALLALALSLLLLVAMGPVYQPWYLAWGLFCLAPVAVGRWQLLFMGVSIYGTISVLPRFEPLVASTGLVGDTFGLVVAVALVALCSTRVEARIRRIDWLPLKTP
jgi:hypothetical protein